MELRPSELNRLIAARHLLQNGAPRATPTSSAMTLAQALLMVHDAAELVFSSIVSARGIPAPEIDNKVRVDPTFMAMGRAVVAFGFAGDPEATSSGIRTIDDLNRLRIAFKHHGQLPDVPSTHQLPEAVIQLLESCCSATLSLSLLSVDVSLAVHSEYARGGLAEARTYIEESKYKEALEAIGKTLANMLFELNTPVHITVGEVSTEEALLLSGRGIDPASFITMQKLLPVCSYGSEDVEWRTRGTGHEANWTYENALFCLETATQTILAIQSAPRIPNPYEFHDVYDDIVTIIADNPSILVTRGFVPFGSENEARLKKGDQVSGRAHGRISPPGESPSLSDVDFEFSEYVALDQPIHPSLGDEADSVFSFRTLWFKTSEVTLSSRSNGRLEQIRKWALEMRARNDDQALS